MGTRSLTIVSEDGADILTLYRQFDGYPTGHGAALADFLRGRVIVNGIPCGESRAKLARMSNGAGCFAAQLVAALKGRDVGNVYVYPPGSNDCGEEYTYRLTFTAPGMIGGAESLAVSVESSGWGDNGASGDADKGKAPAVLFKGTAAEYVAWIRRQTRREGDANRRRRKREGWAKSAPPYTVTDALADLAATVGAMYKGQAGSVDVVAVLRRLGAADDRGHVSRDVVRLLRSGAVNDSGELGRALADAKSYRRGRTVRKVRKLAGIG